MRSAYISFVKTSFRRHVQLRGFSMCSVFEKRDKNNLSLTDNQSYESCCNTPRTSPVPLSTSDVHIVGLVFLHPLMHVRILHAVPRLSIGECVRLQIHEMCSVRRTSRSRFEIGATLDGALSKPPVLWVWFTVDLAASTSVHLMRTRKSPFSYRLGREQQKGMQLRRKRSAWLPSLIQVVVVDTIVGIPLIGGGQRLALFRTRSPSLHHACRRCLDCQCKCHCPSYAVATSS